MRRDLTAMPGLTVTTSHAALAPSVRADLRLAMVERAVDDAIGAVLDARVQRALDPVMAACP